MDTGRGHSGRLQFKRMAPRSLAKKVLSCKTGERLEDVFPFQRVGKDFAITCFVKVSALERKSGLRVRKKVVELESS